MGKESNHGHKGDPMPMAVALKAGERPQYLHPEQGDNLLLHNEMGCNSSAKQYAAEP